MVRIVDGIESEIFGKARENGKKVEVKGMGCWLWCKQKEDAEKDLVHFSSRMSELQYKLFADNGQTLLIILQGVDASGKDRTISHVMGALNP